MTKPPMRVAFLHPDLGIGGAEQLVINLALCCKNLGWDVKIFTPFYDANRAFSQTKDGTIDVEVRGDIFPRRIFGRCQALCDYIRTFLAAIYLILFGGNFDIVIVDQIPLAVPLLKLRFKTFFYCHFPDKLLCVQRDSLPKRIYRFFIDYIEEFTMYFSNAIAVNSKFTQNIFTQSFKIMSKLRELPTVMYPAIDLKSFDKYKRVDNDLLQVKGLEGLKNVSNKRVAVSLNRYENKKNLPLAVQSFIHFIKLKKDEENIDDYILVIAGGYDERLGENIEVYTRLVGIAEENKMLNTRIFFLRSISDTERCILLKNAHVVIYTPKNEHFGIVPVESMYCGAFVIAHKSGGPTESIKDRVTGYLLDNEEYCDWGIKLYQFFEGNHNKKVDEKILKNHVESLFSLDTMQTQLHSILSPMVAIRS